MEVSNNAKDISALFERAGMRNGGVYREFASKRRLSPAAEMSALPSSTQAPVGHSILASSLDLDERSMSEPGAAFLDRLFSESLNREVVTRSESMSLGFYSLAGGVGKTMLAATLAQVLGMRSQRVVLANFSGSHSLRYLYGPLSQEIGPFTILHSRKGDSCVPLTLIEAGDSVEGRDQALRLLDVAARTADAIIQDWPASSWRASNDQLGWAQHVFVPVLPDMQSVVTLYSVMSSARRLFGSDCEVHYILNRYDASRAAHREMYNRIRKMLGDSLAPIPVREDPVVQDAAINGLTVVDHSPNADVVRDLTGVADWVECMLPRSRAAKGMTA